VFEEKTARKGFCGLGSVKSNIGHTSAAAGVAGVHKVLLSLKHGQLPPTLHFKEPNEHFDFADSPFYVNTQLREWRAEGGRPRRAAVSSFGFSGTNAHVVIEEYAEPKRVGRGNGGEPAIFVLSARTEERLKACAGRLLAWLDRADSIDLRRAAYTLQVGREPMENRLAFVVDSEQALRDKLEAYLAAAKGVEGLYVGDVKRSRETIAVFGGDDDLATLVATWVRNKKYAKLLELWVKGLAFDWNRLYPDDKPRRTSLPVYPFAKNRYWVPARRTAAIATARAAAVLHPLLHRNTSDLLEQRYTTELTGDESFLVRGDGEAPVVPVGAYLEMARAAVTQASSRAGPPMPGIRFSGFELAAALPVDVPRQMHIGIDVDESSTISFEVYTERADGERTVHARGDARCVDRPDDVETIELEPLREACASTEQCGDALTSFGFRPRVETVDRGCGPAGGDLALAQWSAAAATGETEAAYAVHPSVVDAAVQVWSVVAGGRVAVVGIDEVEIVRPCPDRGVLHLQTRADRGPDELGHVDIEICGADGAVCVRLRGMSGHIDQRPGAPAATRPVGADSAGTNGSGHDADLETFTLIPRWEAEPAEHDTRSPSADARMLIVGGTARERADLCARYRHAAVWNLDPDAGQDEIARGLETDGRIDHVFWLAPAESETQDARGWRQPGALAAARLVEAQSQGVLACFRLIKGLLARGYGTRRLGWTVVLRGTQAIAEDDVVRPAHASVVGLMGAVAKEYLSWEIRVVDVAPDASCPIEAILHLPYDRAGDPWGYRDGEWYRQRLVACEFAPEQGAPPYRDGGVYVVIGGAGGVGSVFSEHLIRAHRAQVIWLGRREQDARITQELERLAALGPAPWYLSADAASYDSLHRAYAEIKSRYGAIHGIVHSAVVLLDKSVANMDEERFRAALVAKVDVSVNLARVFGAERLDFALFFSSLESFVKAAGQSNYAAGCTFKDAFATRLSSEWSCRVGIMNWGYWGTVGVVSSPEYRASIGQQGLGSIEPADAMAAIERLVRGPFQQIGFVMIAAGQRRLAHWPLTRRMKQLPVVMRAIDPESPPTPRITEDAEAELVE
jgi:NAD(P)-dependent dehydrogenase (short-subunit alcohol dehydrogenase family)